MTRHVRRASLFATFSLLALAWGLVGCQPGFHIFPLPTMVKEGMTTQSFAQDKLECHTYRFLGVDERAHYQTCMEARGYTRK